MFKNTREHDKASKQGKCAGAEMCFETTACPKQSVSIEWQVIFTKTVLSSGRNAINTQRANTTKGPISCRVHSSGSPETCSNNEKLCFPKPLICVSIDTAESTQNEFVTPAFDKRHPETALHKLSSLFFSFTKNKRTAGGQAGSSLLHLAYGPWHQTGMGVGGR